MVLMMWQHHVVQMHQRGLHDNMLDQWQLEIDPVHILNILLHLHYHFYDCIDLLHMQGIPLNQ
jgi:hypothetical protein